MRRERAIELFVEASRQELATLLRSVPIYVRDGGREWIAELIGAYNDALQMLDELRSELVTPGPHEVLLVIDVDGRVEYGSPSVLDELGTMPAQLVGASLYALTHPRDVPVLAEALRDGQRDRERAISARIRLRHRDPDWVILDFIGKQMLRGDEVTGFVLRGRVFDRSAAERGGTLEWVNPVGSWTGHRMML